MNLTELDPQISLICDEPSCCRIAAYRLTIGGSSFHQCRECVLATASSIFALTDKPPTLEEYVAALDSQLRPLKAIARSLRNIEGVLKTRA